MLTQAQPLVHTINAALKLSPQQQVERCLKTYFFRNFIDNRYKIEALSQEFSNNCYIYLGNFVPLLLQTGARGEVAELLTYFAKTIPVADNDLPSSPKISKVSQTDIEHKGVIIPALYYSQSLRQLLSLITANEVIPYSAKEQGLSITRIDRAGYCGNWQYIQHTYQLVWFIETPRTGTNGALEFTTNTLKNKSMFSANQVETGYIQRKYHISGDAFLLKSDTCLHRFAPLTQGSEQVVVTMGFVNSARLENN